MTDTARWTARLAIAAFLAWLALSVGNDLCNECLWYVDEAMEYPDQVGW